MTDTGVLRGPKTAERLENTSDGHSLPFPSTIDAPTSAFETVSGLRKRKKEWGELEI